MWFVFLFYMCLLCVCICVFVYVVVYVWYRYRLTFRVQPHTDLCLYLCFVIAYLLLAKVTIFDIKGRMPKRRERTRQQKKWFSNMIKRALLETGTNLLKFTCRVMIHTAEIIISKFLRFQFNLILNFVLIFHCH